MPLLALVPDHHADKYCPLNYTLNKCLVIDLTKSGGERDEPNQLWLIQPLQAAPCGSVPNAAMVAFGQVWEPAHQLLSPSETTLQKQQRAYWPFSLLAERGFAWCPSCIFTEVLSPPLLPKHMGHISMLSLG